MTTLTITLNGSTQTTASQTLFQLIEELGLTEKRIAIEVNNKLVPRTQHLTYPLTSGDAIEIVQAVGGG